MSIDRPRVILDADRETGTFRATYHYPSQPPSTAVAFALAEITDSDVTDLDPLYETASVNPDALDDLFDSTTGGPVRDGCVTFTYDGYTVTVKSHGRIVLRSSTPPADPSRDLRHLGER